MFKIQSTSRIRQVRSNSAVIKKRKDQLEEKLMAEDATKSRILPRICFDFVRPLGRCIKIQDLHQEAEITTFYIPHSVQKLKMILEVSENFCCCFISQLINILFLFGVFRIRPRKRKSNKNEGCCKTWHVVYNFLSTPYLFEMDMIKFKIYNRSKRMWFKNYFLHSISFQK